MGHMGTNAPTNSTEQIHTHTSWFDDHMLYLPFLQLGDALGAVLTAAPEEALPMAHCRSRSILPCLLYVFPRDVGEEATVRRVELPEVAAKHLDVRGFAIV